MDWTKAVEAVEELTGGREAWGLKNGVLGDGDMMGDETTSTGGGKVGGEVVVGESLHSRRGSLITAQRPFLPALRDHCAPSLPSWDRDNEPNC